MWWALTATHTQQPHFELCLKTYSKLVKHFRNVMLLKQFVSIYVQNVACCITSHFQVTLKAGPNWPHCSIAIWNSGGMWDWPVLPAPKGAANVKVTSGHKFHLLSTVCRTVNSRVPSSCMPALLGRVWSYPEQQGSLSDWATTYLLDKQSSNLVFIQLQLVVVFSC